MKRADLDEEISRMMKCKVAVHGARLNALASRMVPAVSITCSVCPAGSADAANALLRASAGVC